VGPADQASRGNRKPAGPTRAGAVLAALTLFGFAQLDLAGTLALADGRYVVRETDGEEVLVVRTLSAPAPRRRRRRPRAADARGEATALPLTRVTFVRASAPFSDKAEARSWLEGVLRSEAAIDEALATAARVLNRALHAHAVAGGVAQQQTVSVERAALARLGYGSGEEVADGEFTQAREVDPRSGASRQQRRTEELRPQERVAAVLAGRERIDACETLVLRARADLDAGRLREAALQLRVGLEALLVELAGTLEDPGHAEDMTALESGRGEAIKVADTALAGDLDPAQRKSVEDLAALCERVLRRRRVLRG
jgi:hypothetical protein